MTATVDFVLTATQPVVRPTPRHSLILVNYNSGDKLRMCLATLARELAPDTEIIVVDNASTDNSATRLEEAYPHLHVMYQPHNLGFSDGNNLGAQAALGHTLVFLNPDTVVTSGWLTALCAPLAQPTIGLTTAQLVLQSTPTQINACGNDIHLTGLTLCRGLGQPAAHFAHLEDVDAVSGAAFAMRREVFAALGGFDADYFLYMEETDLSWRARLAGYRIVYTPHSVVAHDYALRFGPRKVFYQERNRYLMLLKHLRWPTLLVLLPTLLLAELITWGFVLWSDRAHWRNKLEAYQWVITHWVLILNKRRATQQLRRVPDRELLRHTHARLDFGQTAPRPIALLADLLFTPIFWILRTLTLALVWW